MNEGVGLGAQTAAKYLLTVLLYFASVVSLNTVVHCSGKTDSTSHHITCLTDVRCHKPSQWQLMVRANSTDFKLYFQIRKFRLQSLWI